MKYALEIIVAFVLVACALTFMNAWKPPPPHLVLPAWDK